MTTKCTGYVSFSNQIVVYNENHIPHIIDGSTRPNTYVVARQLIEEQQFDKLARLAVGVSEDNPDIEHKFSNDLNVNKTSTTFKAGTEEVDVGSDFHEFVLSAITNQDTDTFKFCTSFIGNAKSNPHPLNLHKMFSFIQRCELPLTDRGTFLAYKLVQQDFTDFHTGSKDYTPGLTVTEDVLDYDSNRTCSNGLHFCGKLYLPQYGGFYAKREQFKLILVEIDPKDVVAFPDDHHGSKGRASVCKSLVEIPLNKVDVTITLLESYPFVDVEKLVGVIKKSGGLHQRNTYSERLEKVARMPKQRALEQFQESVNITSSLLVSPEYRWYVEVTGIQGRVWYRQHYVFRSVTRECARNYMRSLRESFPGIKVALYDSKA